MAILGYDGSTDALKAVRDGVLTTTIDQYPRETRPRGSKNSDRLHPTGARPATADVLVSPVAITSKNLNNPERIELVK